MRVGLLSYRAAAQDAIGNQLAEKLAFFLERSAQVRVFVQDGTRLHPRVRAFSQVVEKAQTRGTAWEYLSSADLVIADYGHYYDLLHFLPLLKGARPRLLVDYHGVSPSREWSGPHREFQQKGEAWRGLLWHADAVLVHSEFTRAELIQATGLPATRIHKIGLAVDDRLFFPGSDANLRERLNLENARVLLFVGRLAANKRAPLLVEALARLRDLDPPVHAVVAGDAGDVYTAEKRRCQELAGRLGVADRVHFLGCVDDASLANLYRAADVLVTPSVHEGFCLPVVEAMACGLPVVAARAGALPETVGDAGLTFRADDVEDLVRQLRRVLAGASMSDDAADKVQPALACSARLNEKRRVAFVGFRFGADIVGGAETSLDTMARALHHAGHAVEIFTTCTRSESDWSNELPAGCSDIDGIPLRRFPIDVHDRRRHLDTVRQILEEEGKVSTDIESAYLEHSIHSSALIEALSHRVNDFDAIVVGPYLFGLTHDVARRYPAKTLLAPCFHDEAFAWLKVWPEVYGHVGGILYHSVEEQEFAQTRLGLNHPHSTVIGTYLPPPPPPSQGGEIQAASPPLTKGGEGGYSPRAIVYCGRYSRQKEVPTLLAYAHRYSQEHPGRFRFRFMGQGEVPIPRAPWTEDLGRVNDPTKHRVLADAEALLQLSRKESLSLVALEAWAQGTPVIAAEQCAVLAGHIERCGGGKTVFDYGSFARVLDDLWNQPQAWRERGERGRQYVQQHYASRSAFSDRLLDMVNGLTMPIRDHMRSRGLARARLFRKSAWRTQMANWVEQFLDENPKPCRTDLEIAFFQQRCVVDTESGAAFLPIRLTNHGTVALLPEGPARTFLVCSVRDAAGHKVSPPIETCLGDLILPGSSHTLAVQAPVPATPDHYEIVIEAGAFGVWTLPMVVEGPGSLAQRPMCGPLLHNLQKMLPEIHQKLALPDDYLDISEGRLARCKRWLKAKILGNFKRGYVDVLSRQQTLVNRRLFAVVQQLADCCAALDHAVQQMHREEKTGAFETANLVQKDVHS